MTDRDALYAAVLAAPDDDTPRLVYADWCDDAGDADRAAFIRAQVEAARAEPWSPAQRDAEARAAALLGRMEAEWGRATGLAFRTPHFGRGFVEGIDAFADDIGEHLRDIRAGHPIRRVKMLGYIAEDVSEYFPAGFPWAELAGITALDVSDTELHSSVDYDLLAAAEPLAGLTELKLAGRPVPPEWVSRFLAGVELPALAALDLARNSHLGPAIAAGLTGVRHRAFTRLNLSGVRFLWHELKRVLESPAVAGVEELRLAWGYAGEGPARLINLGWLLPWRRLRLLDLAGQGVGPDGVREIADQREAAGVRWLGLARNHIDDSGARRLVESRHLNLYHLDVSSNGISPALLEALRDRFPDAVVLG